MKTLLERHQETCQTLTEIWKDKNARYRNSFSDTLNRYGMVSAVIRLSDKLSRLEYLIQQDPEVVKNPLTDTLLDLANYAIMTIMWMEEKNESN